MINADAAGNNGENLNDEYIVIGNTGDQSIDLSGWTVEDEAAHSWQHGVGADTAN